MEKNLRMVMGLLSTVSTAREELEKHPEEFAAKHHLTDADMQLLKQEMGRFAGQKGNFAK